MAEQEVSGGVSELNSERTMGIYKPRGLEDVTAWFGTADQTFELLGGDGAYRVMVADH